MSSHKHKEAFCVMTYKCNTCGCVEHIWNSRDGVTPFTCGCAVCPGEMQHINWHDDLYRPNYIPSPGQGVWITMPQELKIVVARIRVEGAKGTQLEIKDKEKKEFMIQHIAKGMQPDKPWLIRWPE